MEIKPIHLLLGAAGVGLAVFLSRKSSGSSGSTTGADQGAGPPSPLPTYPSFNTEEAVISTQDASRGLNPALAQYGTVRVYDGSPTLAKLLQKTLHATINEGYHPDADGSAGVRLVGWVDSSEPDAKDFASLLTAIRTADLTQRGYLLMYRPTTNLYGVCYVTDAKLAQKYASDMPWAMVDWKAAVANAAAPGA